MKQKIALLVAGVLLITSLILPAQAKKITAKSNAELFDVFPVCLETNGGTGVYTLTRAKGTIINLNKYVPKKDGYVFTGWFSDPDLTAPVSTYTVDGTSHFYAGWKEYVEPEIIPEPTFDTIFQDITPDDWFYDDIKFAYENGFMSGMEDGKFSPTETVTREMVATILYRIAGKPKTTWDKHYTDVETNAYYENAIIWASEKGIAGGTVIGKFGIGEKITREQLAVMLYRFAQSREIDVTKGADLSAYADHKSISEYAENAMAWTVRIGLLNGKNGAILDPRGNLTRAECAAVFRRLMLSGIAD